MRYNLAPDFPIKRRRFEAAMTRHEKYEYDKIQNVAKELDELPKIQRAAKINKTETVNLLINDIMAAQAKGYSVEKISDFLKQNSFNISPSIIRSCLAKHKTKHNRSKTDKKPKKSDDARKPGDGTVARDVAPSNSPAKSSRGEPGEPGRVVFPPGAARVFTGDGHFIPAPDSDVL